MKRAAIALLAGVAVFAGVFGFAAALEVTSDNLGAGSSGVAACTSDDVHASYTVAWNDGVADEVDGYFQVTNVDVEAPEACGGQAVQIALLDSDGDTLATEDGVLDGDGDTDLGVTADVDAADVYDIHVLITG